MKFHENMSFVSHAFPHEKKDGQCDESVSRFSQLAWEGGRLEKLLYSF